LPYAWMGKVKNCYRLCPLKSGNVLHSEFRAGATAVTARYCSACTVTDAAPKLFRLRITGHSQHTPWNGRENTVA
jgi:hypothetical protein